MRMKQVFLVKFRREGDPPEAAVLVPVTIRYGHWLPKWLNTGGFAKHLTILLRRGPFDLDDVDPAPSLYTHELGHVWQRWNDGFVRYWSRAVADWIRYRTHADRPSEQEANLLSRWILAKTCRNIMPGRDFYEHLSQEAGYVAPR